MQKPYIALALDPISDGECSFCGEEGRHRILPATEALPERLICYRCVRAYRDFREETLLAGLGPVLVSPLTEEGQSWA